MRPKKVILCVDDNEQDLSVLKFMLATNGYRVLSANNGQEAVGIFADNIVDLVLADFAMPQMNGDQLVGRLKQIASHVPMILLGDPQKMAARCKCGCAAGEEELLPPGAAGAHQGDERAQARSPQRHATIGPGRGAGRGVIGCRGSRDRAGGRKRAA